MTLRTTLAAGAAAIASFAVAHAGNVTPDVIFGSGNANGSFTVDTSTDGEIEVGLRGKLRFDEFGNPQNVFNWDGVDTYTFQAGGVPGFGFTPFDDPEWNFEWSVNVNANGGAGGTLSDYLYVLTLDSDPSAGSATSFTFDPINTPCSDHSTGNNATTAATDNKVNCSTQGSSAQYLANLGADNVAQNSWSYSFFQSFLTTFDPNDAGIYTITMSVLNSSEELLASSSINIIAEGAAVPVPAAGLLMMAGLGGIGAMRRKKG